MQVIAKESVYGLVADRTYEVVLREGSFVSVRDLSTGQIFGKGDSDSVFAGRPTIGLFRFKPRY